MVGLILIGFFTGFFTHRQMTINRIEKIADMTRGPGFNRQLLDKLEVTSDQRVLLEPIVQDYGKRLGALHRESRQHRKEVIDSLHAALKPHLTPEQTKRLNSFSKRFRGKPPKGWKAGPRYDQTLKRQRREKKDT